MKSLPPLALAAALATLAGVTLPTRAQTSTQSLRFQVQCLDLDGGLVIARMGPDGFQAGWDVMIAYHSGRAHHGVVVGNQASGIRIARLEGRPYEQTTHVDAAGASFLADPPHRSATPDAVYLIRTDRGALFKLGRVTEYGPTVTLDYELLLPAEAVN